MNTTITTRLGLLVAMLLTILPASAYDFEVDGIYYEITSFTDLTCSVVSGDNKYEGDIVIPSEVTYNSKTLKVTGIGDKAFNSCSSLTSITIPDSVTKIGDYAFSHCTSLTSITIPDSVTDLGGYTFDECTALTSITIPDSVTVIYAYTFYGCTALASITIPDSVTKIGSSAFSHCTSLTSITIPDSVTKIGDYAFSHCTALTSVIIPNTITFIDRLAFRDCISLEEVKLSDHYTTVEKGEGVLEQGAFDGCSSLKSLSIPVGITTIILYGVWNSSKKPENLLFGDCTNLKEIRIGYRKDPVKLVYEKYNFSSSATRYPLADRDAFPSGVEKFYIDTLLEPRFFSLPKLKELTLGEHVTKVQIYPSKSPELETITCYAAVPPTSLEFTNSQYLNTVVKVPNESLDAYKNAEGWKNFWNLEGFDATDAAVDDITAEESISEIGRFDINGHPVSSDYKGIVIVRYSNGSTRKFMNK